MRVNRADFLNKLEMVRSGLATKELIEQSGCFVFKSGKVATFNDEVSCRAPTQLPKEFSGAVKAKPLLDLLRKLQEDEIDVTWTKGELLLGGKGRKAGVTLEKEIVLPIDSVERPENWQELPDDFSEALSIVRECVGTDATTITVYLHIHPKFMEGCDNLQLVRYKISMGVESAILVRGDSIKDVANLGASHFAETDSWVHFKNSVGVVYSCRRYLERYPDISKLYEVKGTPTVLPKGLAEAAEMAEIFSSENPDTDHVLIELKPGKLRIKGRGTHGWYSEVRRLPKYDGIPMKFTIGPKMLKELIKRRTECEVCEDRIRVNGGNWTYVTCLSVPEEE